MIYILLPVFNEEQSLGELIPSIHAAIGAQCIYTTCAVNDGSTDNSLNTLIRLNNVYPIAIVNHKLNMGLGCAIGTGFAWILERIKPDDVVVTMDADNTHPPELIKTMLQKISEGNSVVIASRYRGASVELGVPVYRKLLSYGARLLFSMLFPHPEVRDYSSGYRIYSSAALLTLQKVFGKGITQENGFAVMTELIIKCMALNFNIKEVPLRLMYCKKKGKSKIKIIRTIIQYFAMVKRLWRIKQSLKKQL